jgi:hypothetical protein
MNRYQISSPRKAFAIASVAMTAITVALSVVVPAKMRSNAGDVRTLAAIKVVAPAPVAAATGRLHIDVVGIREPEFASVQVPSPPKRKQES